MSTFKVKSLYDKPSADDGLRVLVAREWPADVEKELAKVDDWEKELAPNRDLLEFFHKEKEKNWDEFTNHYKRDLERSAPIKEFLVKMKFHDVVTLLFAAKDTNHNYVDVLKEFLDKQ